MHPIARRFTLGLIGLCSLPLALGAGLLEVTLTDGTVLQGEVMGNGPKRLILKVDGKTHSIAREDIASETPIEAEIPGVQWGPELPPPAPINSSKPGEGGGPAPRVAKTQDNELDEGGSLPKLKAGGKGAAPADKERSLFSRPSHPDMVNLIQNDLIDSQGNSTDLSSITKAEYVLLYFSAHWCPPCRAFTPELVRYYRQHNDEGKFEVVFISGDKSEQAMMQYMRGDKMPWVAVRYGSKAADKLRDRYAGPGIPCLVLLNRRDKVISDSYVGNEYRGPQAVLRDLQEKME